MSNMISTPHALAPPENHSRYFRNKNHRKGNLVLHNDENVTGVSTLYSPNGQQNIMRHPKIVQNNDNNELLNEFYPPPPKLTTFSVEDIGVLQEEQQQSYHYMVNLNKRI